MILTPFSTFPIFLLPSVSQLIIKLTLDNIQKVWVLVQGTVRKQEGWETRSQSKENLRGRKPQVREEVDRQVESNLGH